MRDSRMISREPSSSRRRFLRTVLVAPIVLASGAWFRWLDGLAAAGTLAAASAPGGARRVAPTPDCGDDDEPTPAETEGPFFKPRSPQRRSLLEPGISGTKIVLEGRVFSRGCRPIAGALLDFWHADDSGHYDNAGFKLRGHQFADAAGRYRLETIVPGLYPGRTRHIHVKVQAPHGRVLTTQLYFPGEPRNHEDELFRSDLLLSVRSAPAAKQVRFHFVLDVD